MNLDSLRKDKSLAGTDYISRMVKAMNYSQLTGIDPMEAFDFQEEISQDVNKMVKNPLVGPQLAKFNPDADDKTDPITGATAKDYSGLLGTFVSTAKAAGYNTRSAAELGISSFLKNLDLTVDYISRTTGLEKGGLFKKLHEESLARGNEFKTRAKEEGIGPVTEFFTDLVGGVIPGITDFLLDLPVVFPLHGTRGAEKAAVRGDNEFVGMLKGSMERNLMGQIFHAASVLPRTARVPIIGGMFAEQARSGAKEEGQDISPEDYAKAFLTGGIFGTMGGEGKIGMRDVVREIHSLEREFPVTIGGSKGGPGEGLLGGERGSLAPKEDILTGLDSGLDITKLPEVIRGLAKTGKELFESGKKTKEEWSAAMKDSLGPEWEKVKDQVEEVWVLIEASQTEGQKKKPLLTMAVDVDGEIAKAAEGIAGNHGQIPLTDTMIKKLEQEPPPPDMVIRNGWVDENGNWFSNAEAVAAKDRGEVDIGVRAEPKPGIPPSPEKGGLDLGPDLTPSEASSLIESIAGGKIDPGTLVKMDPAISKLIKDTQKALGPRRLEAIKTTIRRETGQTKVSTILEVKEDVALRDQIRFAARQAKIAFSSAVKVTRVASADYFHAMIERARAKRKQGEETRSMISDLKAIDPSTMTDYARTEITGLIEGLDLTRLPSKKHISLQKTREYLDRNPETELPDHVLDDLARLDKTAVRDLTFDDLKSLHTSIMHLKEMSDKSQHLWDGIQKRKFKDALDGSLEEMRPPDLIVKEIVSTKPSLRDKLLSVGDWVRQTLGIRQDSYDLIVETLAGMDSTMYRVLYRMIKEGDRTGVIPGKGTIGQKKYVQDAHAAYRDDLEATGFFNYPEVKNTDKWLNERVKVKGDKTWELSRGERMAIYMHSLNADNLKSMLESGIGFKRAPESSGIKPNETIQISETDLNKIVASLSPAERAFVIPAQKLFERQGMDLDKAFYDLNKYRMELVDNYYPKEVMPLSRGGMDLETEDGMEAFRQFTARVGIDKGMLISRQGSSKPIYINDLMSDVTRSVNRSSAYINLEGPMRNASHLLYDNEFKKNLIDRYGRETWVELEKGLKDISNQYRSWTETEKGVMRLKTNAVSSILSLNPWIWLNQPASLVFYNAYVDAKYILRAGLETASPSGFKGILDTIRSFSPEIVDRLQGGYDRDIAAAYQQAREKEFYGGTSTLKEKGLTPTRYADMTAVVPGMRAAYLKAMDEFQTGKVSETVRKALDIDPSKVQGWTPEDYEVQAWKFADWVTERTQAQASPEHRSSLSRSSSTLEQVFTSLASQQNAMLGLVRRTQREYKRTGDPEDRDAMVKAYLHVFVVNAAFMIGIDKVRDLLYGRSESKTLTQAVIDNAAGLVMFLREVESSVTSHLFKGERGYDIKYPVQRFGEIMVDMASTVNTMVTTKDMKVKKEARNKFLDQSLSLMAILSGYPYQTPKRIFDAAAGNNPKKKVSNEPDFIDELIE